VIQGVAAGLIVFFGVYTYEFRDFYRLNDYVRLWPINGLIIVGGLGLKVLIGTSIAIMSDKVHLMRISGSLNLILAFTACAFAILLCIDSSNYSNNFNCFETMAQINERDFENFSCS